jgi:hypothetical protein
MVSRVKARSTEESNDYGGEGVAVPLKPKEGLNGPPDIAKATISQR